MNDTITTDWASRIREARENRNSATAIYEQTIRDAHASGRSQSQIARDLGITDRTTIARILSEQPDTIPAPKLPVVVSTSARDARTQRLDPVMHQRGWHTASRTSAWHLSKAGATVVLVDAGKDIVSVSVSVAKGTDPSADNAWRDMTSQRRKGVYRHEPTATNNIGRQGANVLDEQWVARLVADLLD